MSRRRMGIRQELHAMMAWHALPVKFVSVRREMKLKETAGFIPTHQYGAAMWAEPLELGLLGGVRYFADY